MIATLDTPFGRAALGADGVWASDNPALAAKLNHDHPPGSGLSVLPWGYGAAVEAGVAFGVSPAFADPLPPLPPGVIS